MPHESTVAHEHEQKLSREDGNATVTLEKTATTVLEDQNNFSSTEEASCLIL